MIVSVRRASFACECTSLPEVLVPLPAVWLIVGSGAGLCGTGGDDGGTAFVVDVAAIVNTFSRAFCLAS
jgi:hypothetical protein